MACGSKWATDRLAPLPRTSCLTSQNPATFIKLESEGRISAQTSSLPIAMKTLAFLSSIFLFALADNAVTLSGRANIKRCHDTPNCMLWTCLLGWRTLVAGWAPARWATSCACTGTGSRKRCPYILYYIICSVKRAYIHYVYRLSNALIICTL